MTSRPQPHVGQRRAQLGCGAHGEYIGVLSLVGFKHFERHIKLVARGMARKIDQKVGDHLRLPGFRRKARSRRTDIAGENPRGELIDRAGGLARVALQFGALTLDITASAKIADPATRRMLMVATTSKATGLRKAVVEQSGSFAATWDASCVSLSGSFVTTNATTSPTVNWATTLTDYHRCAGKCPDTGRAVIVSPAGRQFTLRFDGTTTSSYTSSSGRTGTITLLCSNS